LLDDNISRKVRHHRPPQTPEIMALQLAANVLKWSRGCQSCERFNNVDSRKVSVTNFVVNNMETEYLL